MPNWEKACRVLSRRDHVMAGLISAGGPTRPVSRGAAFETLVRSIVGQQISVAAAASIWKRFSGLVSAVEPGAVCGIPCGALLRSGLSKRKAEYIVDLALHFDSGRISPRKWEAWDDEQVVADLMRIRGVGRWTAEMFLIFHLQRPDVFSIGDAGLRRAVEFYYGLGEPMLIPDILELSECWRPWRSVASWYLWRSLEPLPVEY